MLQHTTSRLLLCFTWCPQETRQAAECLLRCCSSVAALLQLCCSFVAAFLRAGCSTEDDEMGQETREAAESLEPSLTVTYAHVRARMLTYAAGDTGGSGVPCGLD